MYKPKFKHPIGKKLTFDDSIDENCMKDLDFTKYQALMDDIYIENLTRKYLRGVKTLDDLINRYERAYLSARRKKDFKIADKIREIASDIGFEITWLGNKMMIREKYN